MGFVNTVTGKLSGDDLGVTLAHEHILKASTGAWIDDDVDRPVLEETHIQSEVTFENLWRVRERPYTHDNSTFDDIELAIDEISRFQEMGGETIVDLTTSSGSDPMGLKRIAHRRGMNIVTGTGYYVGSSHPADMSQRTVEELANEFISDISSGIGETDIKAGVIGEIGATKGFLTNSNEKKVFRGAARAQAETGAPISVHPPFNYEEAHDILDLLEEAGADLDNVVMGHLSDTIRNEDSLEYHRSIGDRGAFLAFDDFGMIGHRITSTDVFNDVENVGPLDEDRINRVVRLYRDGFADQLLISQDICRKTHLTKFGGHGYGHILRNIVPRLKQSSPLRDGLSSDAVDKLLIENPRKLLTIG